MSSHRFLVGYGSEQRRWQPLRLTRRAAMVDREPELVKDSAKQDFNNDGLPVNDPEVEMAIMKSLSS